MKSPTSYDSKTATYTLVAGYGDTEKTFVLPQSLPDVEFLAQVVKALEYASSIGDEEAVDWFEDFARDISEDLEVLFVYTQVSGKTRTYTPASLWESSGGCEWEESAQWGYDYGWNI